VNDARDEKDRRIEEAETAREVWEAAVRAVETAEHDLKTKTIDLESYVKDKNDNQVILLTNIKRYLTH